MPQVLIHELDPAVFEKLEARARQNNRSLEAELCYLLQRAVEESPSDPLANAKRIKARFIGQQFSDSVELIREDRER